MKQITVKIDEKLNNKTVKSILKDKFAFSTALITVLKKYSNGILLNGERVKTNHTVKQGDILTLNIHAQKNSTIEPVPLKIDVLYEDEDIIIVNKPPFMPTHPSPSHYTDTLANALVYYFRDTDFTFSAITRLDSETSGVVLVAKNKLASSLLSKQMENHTISKKYCAVCHNTPPKKCGEINAPISRSNTSIIKREVNPNGKASITQYKVKKYNKNANISLVNLYPKTGRTHQIRVHLSYIGCPIYGDDMYGSPVKGERVRLHCAQISFVHPTAQNTITVKAPLPQDFNIV